MTTKTEIIVLAIDPGPKPFEETNVGLDSGALYERCLAKSVGCKVDWKLGWVVGCNVGLPKGLPGERSKRSLVGSPVDLLRFGFIAVSIVEELVVGFKFTFSIVFSVGLAVGFQTWVS